MNMLHIHQQALSNSQATYHEFLLTYSKNNKTIYGFVEGKEDPCFYRGCIQNVLPDEWHVVLWPTGGRKTVLRLYRQFDWSRFEKKRILFFIDKDISPLVGTLDPKEPNLYVTDKYSIENSIIDRVLCERVLTEVLGLEKIRKSEMVIILDKFEKEYARFRDYLTKIMCWVIVWRRNGEKACLNDMPLHKLFTINKGKLIRKFKPEGYSDISKFIHAQLKIQHKKRSGIRQVVAEYIENNGKDNFVRGKYLVWFFVQFVLSIHYNITMFAPYITKPPKLHINLGVNNFSIIVGPRARIPKSLKMFLKATCVAYTKM